MTAIELVCILQALVGPGELIEANLAAPKRFLTADTNVASYER
jgi:hypothetical protein